MAYSTINKSSLHQNTKLYTGNGSTQSITGVGFQPDLVWLKDRDATNNHNVYDAPRGATKVLLTNAINAETTSANGLTAFDSDGFSLGNDAFANTNGNGIVSWNFKGNGAGSSNSDGSVTATVSANATAGFSICSWTGTGSNLTVGHGLGKAPEMIITMNRDAGSGYWVTYHKDLSASPQTSYIYLVNNSPSVNSYATFWNSTVPTSSVFSIGTDTDINTNAEKMIAYCFTSITGYSKVGTYLGNNNADGSFIYCGFKPRWILVRSRNLTSDWYIFDALRDGMNSDSASYANRSLRPNSTATEATASGYYIDILSNGFKARTNNSAVNGNGDTYIYYAVGQTMVGSNNVPATGR